MLILDTDTCIFLLNRKNASAETKLRDLGRDEAAVTTITMAELYFGAAHSKNRAANEKKVEIFCSSLTLLPFDASSAEIFGNIKETLISEGKIIGIMDLLIASIALAARAVLVTHNQREFLRIAGLKTEDWFGD